MNRTRTLVCLIASALLIGAAPAQDDVPEWPEREIEFETSDEPLEVTDFTARPGQIWPRFAVAYTADAVHGFLAWSREDAKKTRQQLRTDRLLETSLAKQLSEQQREFVRSSTWVQTRSIPQGTLEGYSGSATQCTLYAVSEEDARLMAEATLEMHDADRRARFEEAKNWLLKHRARLAEAEGELPAAERGVEDTKLALESARKAAPHKNRDAAQEDIDRLEVSLWSIEVSVAGVNAKIGTIQRLKAGKDNANDFETSRMLDRLLMEQDVELAGLLAQREIVASRLNLANAYVTAGTKYDQAVGRVAGLRDSIAAAKTDIEKYEERLNSRQPVRVFGNVVIQPIKYPGE